ncbi:HTH_Tnp_Tc3_2 domain-containing protein [Trichonephila clavipes]|nr:HTH_Tnp_Tc3_2 domain-containing protein [Trichonephila clavipes]
MSSNTRCSGLARQRRYSTSRKASAFSDLNPIENKWNALGGKLLVETILRQTRTPSSVHSQRNLPQQLLDNVVQKTYRPPPWSERYGSCSVLAKWITEGRVYRRGGSGRPRNTNDREDRAIRKSGHFGTNSVASIDSTPRTSFQTSSAIKRNHKGRRLTEVGLRSRRPLRRLPLTPHHKQCRLDFCRPRQLGSVTDWRRVIFSDESDSVSVMMTTAHVSGGAPASGPIRHLLSSGIQHFTRCDSVGSNFLGHTIIFSGPSRHFDSCRYVDDILTPIVLPMLSSRPGAIYQQDNARPHTARLSQQKGYDVLPWPARCRSFANRACLDALGRQLQPS